MNLQKLLNTMIQRRKNIKNFKQICLRRGRFIQQGINTHIEDVKKTLKIQLKTKKTLDHHNFLLTRFLNLNPLNSPRTCLEGGFTAALVYSFVSSAQYLLVPVNQGFEPPTRLVSDIGRELAARWARRHSRPGFEP